MLLLLACLSQVTSSADRNVTGFSMFLLKQLKLTVVLNKISDKQDLCLLLLNTSKL